MIAKNFLLPILLSFGLGAPYFIAWAPAEGDPQKGKKGAEMPKQIQDKRKPRSISLPTRQSYIN